MRAHFDLGVASCVTGLIAVYNRWAGALLVYFFHLPSLSNRFNQWQMGDCLSISQA